MGGGALIVLDTHAAIWYAGGMKMRRPALAAVDAALDGAGALLSAISAWEIGMLIAKRRLVVTGPAETYVRSLFGYDGIVEEPVTAQIAVVAATLSHDFHGDPADRIIVATAVLHGASLVTRDERILAYLRRTKAAPVIAC